MEIPVQRETTFSRFARRLSPRLTALLLACLCALFSVGRVAVVDSSSHPLVFDGVSYAALGQSLAAGRGFRSINGDPATVRPPLWPFLISLALRASSHSDSVRVVQLTAGILHVIASFAVAWLTFLLSGRRGRALLAAAAVSLWPPAQQLLTGGACEPCASAVLCLGTLLICLEGPFYLAGVVVLSFLPLVRPNLVLLLPLVAAVAGIRKIRYRIPYPAVLGNLRWLIATTVLFCAPSAAWMIRNYSATGEFPLLAGTGEEALYGNYNQVSATMGPGFGEWVSPRGIPGSEAAHGMPVVKRRRYYKTQALRFMADHWPKVPLLMASHAIRAVLPDPMERRHAPLYWLPRLALYILAVVAVRKGSFRANQAYALMLAAVACDIAMTVLAYSGDYRYVYPLDILLIPLVVSMPLVSRASRGGAVPRYSTLSSTLEG